MRLIAPEMNIGFEKSDRKLVFGMIVSSVRKASLSVKPDQRAGSRVDPIHFPHYGECVNEPTRIALGRDDVGRRADRVVRKVLRSVPLSTIYRLFRQKRVRVGARVIGAEERLKPGDTLNLFLPSDLSVEAVTGLGDPSSGFDETTLAKLPDQPRVVWENEHLVALHKPRGMLTHDGNASLEAFVCGYLRDRVPASASFTPGPLHRLDRNTSGIIMFSKSRTGAESFSSALAAHRIRKFYIAIAQGEIEEGSTLEDKLSRDQLQRRTVAAEQGIAAKLRIAPLAANAGATLALIELFTGLTHQIRAQLSAHGHPLKGDAKYGNHERVNPDGYFLHAHTLALPPFSNFEAPLLLSDPLPSDFKEYALSLLRSSSNSNSCAVEGLASPSSESLDKCILKIIKDMIYS